MDDLNLEKQKIEKSCAVCKFAILLPLLDRTEEAPETVTCTVDPNHPVLKPMNDTCLKHKPKYKNLKVIVEKTVLQEYDVEKIGFVGAERIPDLKIIGEDEWVK